LSCPRVFASAKNPKRHHDAVGLARLERGPGAYHALTLPVTPSLALPLALALALATDN